MVGPRLHDTVTTRGHRSSSCRLILILIIAMGRHTRRMVVLSLLALSAARAHEHDEDLSEEAAHAPIDSILWIHIFLQAAVWGILFPIGMVFGLSRSRWHVPLQVRPRPRPPTSSPFSPHSFWFLDWLLYHGFILVIPSPLFIVGHRDRAHARRLRTRAHARWPTISSQRAWQVCQYPPHADCGAACARHVPQAAHPRAYTAALGCARARYNREVVSGAGMGPDALWCDRFPQVLS